MGSVEYFKIVLYIRMQMYEHFELLKDMHTHNSAADGQFIWNLACFERG